MEIKFPSGYVGPLSSKIAKGKLRGLKTHDFHILLQQVLPLCLRNVGNSKVVGAIMRVSILFRNICSKGRGKPATTLTPGLMKAPPMIFTFSSYIMEKKAF